MAVKRRIVWFSDQDWAGLAHIAEVRGDSISRVLRDMLRLSRPTEPGELAEPPAFTSGDIPPSSGGPRGWTQDNGGTFNRRPFTPVPKKGK